MESSIQKQRENCGGLPCKRVSRRLLWYNSSIHKSILKCFVDVCSDEEMKLMICGHVRAQAKFNSLDSLKDAIRADVDATVKILDTKPYFDLREAGFFKK
mmetsp:Transcript_33950/g.54628  ORF Transcript_33950/g.54628 Transcript_33950/m.54628 type:complete len:100 (-) Transcript_33950:175-474(-)